jgi:uncharacterized protein YgbK (DUF1537 family)
LAEDLGRLAKTHDRSFLLVSRSDSTLRGHYPVETQALYDTLSRFQKYDGEIIIPFFQEGGRVTLDDVHYVIDGDRLVPVGETEFAKDPVFGYTSSNLKTWVAEKTGGAFPEDGVKSVSLETLRKGDIQAVKATLDGLSGLETLRKGDIQAVKATLDGLSGFNKCIVNAMDLDDLEVFFKGLLQSLAKGKNFIFRTAASFVQVAGGIGSKPLLTRKTLFPEGHPGTPGIVIVGSHVRQTTRQWEQLRAMVDLEMIHWDVNRAESHRDRRKETVRVITAVESALKEGRDVCVYTSRVYICGSGAERDPKTRLMFSNKVSAGLTGVIRGLRGRPAYVVAKGGITSSDIAVKGLNVGKAYVLGQIQAGVPVWKLGNGSKFEGIPYVVFPGNVGDEHALRRTVEILRDR